MYILVTVVLVIFLIMAHEAGHFVAMRKRGVKVLELTIGIPVPYLTYNFRWSRFPDTLFRISPLLFLAYVKPENGRTLMESLSYRDQAIISGAGVTVNFFMAVLLLMAGATLKHLADRDLLWHVANSGAYLFVAFLIFVFRGWLCRLMPFLGTVFFIVLIGMIFKDPSGTVNGPVGTVKIITDYSISLASALTLGGGISLSLGILNMLPLLPMDGGHITRALLKRWPVAQQIHAVLGFVIFISLILWGIWSDFTK